MISPLTLSPLNISIGRIYKGHIENDSPVSRGEKKTSATVHNLLTLLG